ncbi:MAG: MgtC/SapB family protein [Gammaproteobacteria bacterium]|nr:MgtC/SapB family protein [Gammaproteobacteria bacterium]
MTELGAVELFTRFGLALAIGLLVGLERGWHKRGREFGAVAGTRTFALTALLGALSGLLAQAYGGLLLGMVFAAMALVLFFAHRVEAAKDGDPGITTAVAGLVTFGLGATVMHGYLAVSAALGVVTMVLLGTKPMFREAVARLEQQELYAIFKLLLITVVVLPVLPNEGYGPWNALNPYAIWWMVVLIGGISFVGYFAVKLIGPRLGLGATALFGGLAASTAVTLNFSRLGRSSPSLRRLLSAGILLASGTMFPRVLLLAWLLHPPMGMALVPAMAVMGAVTYGGALWLWRRSGDDAQEEEPQGLKNPFDLRTALQFGLLLVVILLFAHGLREWLGDAGLYVLAAVSGLNDVDAINLSTATMSRAGDVATAVAATTVTIAAISNTLVKAGMAGAIGGMAMGRYVGGVLVLAAVAGGAVVLL